MVNGLFFDSVKWRSAASWTTVSWCVVEFGLFWRKITAAKATESYFAQGAIVITITRGWLNVLRVCHVT